MLKITNIKFYEKRNLFFAISISLFLLGAIMMIINGVNLDIQFKGGTILKYGYEGDISREAVIEEASKSLGINVDAQLTQDFNSKNKQISISLASDEGLTPEKQNALFQALQTKFASNKLTIAEQLSVDPFYGREFFEKGLLAIGLAAIFIVLYVWLRFRTIHGLSAGMFALVALLHDVLMVFVTFIVFRIPINDAFIAVVLTIIGYSINDTIVIYDRMRENQRIFGRKISLGDLINLSQNQSLTRTINTSMNTFFSMVVVVIVSIVFNLESIRSFALPMMVGIISGCYSTLFIACPLWVLWNTRGGKNQPVQEKSKKTEAVKAAEPKKIGDAGAAEAPIKAEPVKKAEPARPAQTSNKKKQGKKKKK